MKTVMPPADSLGNPDYVFRDVVRLDFFNAQKTLALAARELGTLFNTGEGGMHPGLKEFGDCAVVQVASGRFGVHKAYLDNSRFIEIKIGQGAKPGIGGHLPVKR